MVRIYEASLRFVVVMAIKNLYPQANVSFNYNVSRSVLTIIRNLEGGVTEELVNEIKAEVCRIVEADYPITRKFLT